VTQGFEGGTLSCKCVDNVASFDTSQCCDACETDSGSSGGSSGTGGSSIGGTHTGGAHTGGAHTGGSSGSDASTQKTRLESADDGGCSVRAQDGDDSPSTPLFVIGLALALCSRRSAEKTRDE
jgi:MYXO-CTERM domain-containing protein